MRAADYSAAKEEGRSLRRKVPRSGHGDWVPAPGRPGPVALIEEQNETRPPWLMPVRRARMAVSPLTFYRGTARIMASDLAATFSVVPPRMLEQSTNFTLGQALLAGKIAPTPAA